jgi:hypothetical protein
MLRVDRPGSQPVCPFCGSLAMEGIAMITQYYSRVSGLEQGQSWRSCGPASYRPSRLSLSPVFFANHRPTP